MVVLFALVVLSPVEGRSRVADVVPRHESLVLELENAIFAGHSWRPPRLVRTGESRSCVWQRGAEWGRAKSGPKTHRCTACYGESFDRNESFCVKEKLRCCKGGDQRSASLTGKTLGQGAATSGGAASEEGRLVEQ